MITTDLVLRSAPGTGEESQIYEERLQDPTLLFVMDGPVAASGYDWYYVQPFGQADSFQIRWPPAGWVAAGSQQGEPWIAARGISCPHTDNVETADLAELHPLEALACFGDRTLRVRARSMICPGIVSDEPPVPNYTIAPGWLGSGQGCALHTADGRTVYGAAAPFFAPEILDGVPAGWIWLGGQFDHPAASSCVLRRQTGDPDMPAAPDLDDVQTVLLCRSHFAVTSTEAARAISD